MRLALVVVLLVAAGRADAGELRDLDEHVRTTDAYVRAVVREALATSPSFRTLVARLVRSDVIVYLMRDPVMPQNIDAQVSFITAAGGVRYLAVRLLRTLPPRRLVAMIAHELQHAVEIADAPWVVDDDTLAREYERMGGDDGRLYDGIRAFDSGAAILAGERAWREYQSVAR